MKFFLISVEGLSSDLLTSDYAIRKMKKDFFF